ASTRDRRAQRCAIEPDQHAALADLAARVLQPRPGRAAEVEHARAGREQIELVVELLELVDRAREEAFALRLLVKAIATDRAIGELAARHKTTLSRSPKSLPATRG